MRIALIVIALAPWGFPCVSYTDEYIDEVELSRVAWWADWALPADTCGEPRVQLRDLPCDAECSTGFYVAGSDTILIRDDMSDADTRAAVRHETVHWLAWCTGYQASGDAGHADPSLWGNEGVLARAEASQ